jgi:hypothetical protein
LIKHCGINGCWECRRELIQRAEWSEREAVVAYLLSKGRGLDLGTAGEIARGFHLEAARRGDLDRLRDRVRGMVTK